MPISARLLVLSLTCFIALGCGGGSEDSNSDQTLSVSITAPSAGASVQGTVTLSCRVSGASSPGPQSAGALGVTGATAPLAASVQFYVDGELIGDGVGAETTFSLEWDSNTGRNGSRTLKAVATDGDQTAEDEVSVTVSNTGGVEVSVTVSPPTAQVQVEGTQSFTATVTGATNTAVTWEVIGGSGNGTITGQGVYTAPASVPNPVTVTVRATSEADPSKSGQASVTVSEAGAFPPEELSLLVDTYTAGFDILGAIDLANDLVFQAIFFASCSNGNQPTLTGTVTETSAGSGEFQWTSSPTDKLIVVFGDGRTYEIVVNPDTVNGDVGNLDCGDWESFKLLHVIEYTIDGPEGSLSIGSARVPQQGDENAKDVQATVSGNLTLEGTTTTVNANVQGVATFFIVVGQSSSSTTTHDLTVTGSAQSGSTTFTLEHRQTFRNEFFSSGLGSDTFINRDDFVGNSGTGGGVSFSFSELTYSFTDTDDRDPIYQGSGLILRNGATIGNFVVDSASGASGIELLSGEIVPF